jgi:hypothetical protein
MPRTLCIPTIGDEFVLEQEWTFTLHEEHRNVDFAEVLGVTGWEPYPWRRPSKTHEVTLPKGTRLKVDRIYIRKGADEFGSLTFYCNPHLKGAKAKGAIKGRFWAKLSDVNTMVIE